MKVEQRKISSLIPYAKNAKKHSDKQIQNVAKSIKLIKKNAPQVKWIISFADGTQCGDGTIYRASNFVLTDIRRNTQIRINPETGEKLHMMTAYHRKMIKDFKSWDAMDGYQLRYVYFIDPKYRKRLTVPEIPFSMAGMYKGEKITQAERHAIKTPKTS